MVVIWAFGRIFKSLSLPLIFGELIGGIVVGPLIFGLVDPENEAVKILSELGIFFLMLHAGLETDPHQLIKSSKKSIFIAIGGVLLPFIGGYFTSRVFDRSLEESLFIAMGLSITAIAISARIFKEYKMQKSNIAHITLGAAVIDDILALILFSLVLSIAKTGEINFQILIFMLLKVVIFFGLVIFIGFKTSRHLPEILRKKGFTFSLIIALVLGLIAEKIGLHFVIGSFLAGLFIRQEIIDEKIFNKIEDRLYGLSYSFLGPIFFASLAFHLDFSSFRNTPWFLVAILIVAILGKIIGSGGAALLQKINLKDSLIIGNAMNSSGAVEMIIAAIGIKEGIIDKDVFSILVIMAFLTTFFSILFMRYLMKNYQISQ